MLIVVCMFISSIDARPVYIKYPWPKYNNNGCDPRFPTAACYLRKRANPYRRGCSCANRCRRDCSQPITSLKKFVEKVLAIPV